MRWSLFPSRFGWKPRISIRETFGATDLPVPSEQKSWPLARKIAKYPYRLLKKISLFIAIANLWFINRIAKSRVTSHIGPAVCLTTHGKRTSTVYLAIESIARGSRKPSRLILWLDDPRIFNNLPTTLVRLQNRGLEIQLVRNYGPHTKYYPYVESLPAFSSALVTADDDILYPRYWLSRLIDAFEQEPDCVNCYRAREIVPLNNDLANGRFPKYNDWPLCTTTAKSFRLLATGVSGVIYPPDLLLKLKRAGRDFERACPKADDLWLHVQALRGGYPIRQIGRRSAHFPIVPDTQDISLYSTNATEDDGNDRQIRSTYQQEDIEALIADRPSQADSPRMAPEMRRAASI